MVKKNLWILTEERPKRKVIATILSEFSKDQKIPCFIDTIRILPILKNGKFSFLYEVVGFRCNKIEKVFIKTVSGYSSFVDFLVFYQNKKPIQTDKPLYLIEETKTDDIESRNTGVYQRSSKFVYSEYYYPGAKKIMLYNLKIKQKEKATSTYIFGTKLLKTIKVKIIGKKLEDKLFTPFKNIEEMIDFKKGMKLAPKGNVPISVKKNRDSIFITGRLYKSNGLSHDPNIGALSLIAAVIRKLRWKSKIIIKDHGLMQKHLKGDNKFIKIANRLNIELEGLELPKSRIRDGYWKYETEGEKLGTIFIHSVVENFTKGYSIFENHAGCEKGYFITKNGDSIPLKKYSDRKAYKKGNKKKIIAIPDLILIDFGRSEIINIEGKKYKFRQKGARELKAFKDIEKLYIEKYYPKFEIIRTVVLYGGKAKKIVRVKFGFLLNENGDLVLGIRAPELFKKAIENLLDFWS